MPNPNVIPATPHEVSVQKLFDNHLNKPVKHPGDEIPPKTAEVKPIEVKPSDQSILEYAITNRYSYHTPQPDQIPKYETIRQTAANAARTAVSICPPCNELERALEALDAFMMFSNAAIARHSG